MTTSSNLHKDLLKALLLKVLPGILVLLLIFFLPAGTIWYWQAWLYLAVLFIPVGLVLMYLWRKDPELLRRRLKSREREGGQKFIVLLSAFFLLPAFLLPGFDVRLGWSNAPIWMVLLGDLMVLFGYLIFFKVLRENSYASRVVEVETGQKVISSGPYSVVRHPMYVGVLLMDLFSPLALGSFWAMIPAAGIILILVLRIKNEEEVLLRDLPGYSEYVQKVKYHLIPGVW